MTAKAKNPKIAQEWGRRHQRAPLSPQFIVTTALNLVEKSGLAALSTRRLGGVLDCEAMSIYHHFPSKQHLLDGMVDRVIEEFNWPAPGPAPDVRVRQLCYAYRDLAYRYPRFFAYVAFHRLNSPTGVRFIDGVLAIVETLVADHERAARYFRVLGYYLTGCALDETSGYAAGPSAAEPVSDAYIAANCPRLAAAARYFGRAQWDATFDLGLEAIMAAMMEAR